MSEVEHIMGLGFSREDAEFMAAKKPDIETMETDCEIFDLPSGRELTVWCDGRWKLDAWK